MLEIDGLDVYYDTSHVLKDVSLTVEAGTVTAIIGPNGAGKTTLFDAISGVKAYEGSIEYEGTEVSGLTERDLVERGLVHCPEKRDLFPFFSVEENLQMGAHTRSDSNAIEADLEMVYDLFPRLHERKSQEAKTLSGGEQQMLAIGRALMSDPDLLLLDEPTLGLAPVIIEAIDDIMDTLLTKGLTIFLAEQNAAFAMNHASYLYLLETGSIVKRGPVDELVDDEYVRESFVGAT